MYSKTKDSEAFAPQFKSLSIVVQGMISECTSEVLASIRRCFPHAELILSTWEGSDCKGLDYDKLVFSPDPGAQKADEIAHTDNNVNRQIVSTCAGLKVASRTYILKTRTDIVFNDGDFLRYFGRYDDSPPVIFLSRLLICNYYTRNPRSIDLCFHPSDWILFGYAEDIRKYYGNTPLQTDENAAWFKAHPKNRTLFTNYLSRFTPEQYIFLSFLQQYCDVKIDCYYDFNLEFVHLTEKIFAKCFVVLDYQKQINIDFVKYEPNRYLEKNTLMSHRQWLSIYSHYCVAGRSCPQWYIYCASKWLSRFLFLIRKVIVNLLDVIGIKEAMKSLLLRNNNSR